MPARSKATDEQLIEAYGRLGNVHKVGRLFGMRGTSAHERLVKLRVAKPINVFTDREKDVLRAVYWVAADAGKLAALADKMGRTKQFLCRQARALGLTDKRRSRPYNAVWKYVSEEYARPIFEQFKSSSLNLGLFCKSRNYDDLGFSVCMKRFFPDEWEHVIEAKQTSQTLYRLGRGFEYQVRDYLKKLGYVAMRSPASKSPIDLIAVRPGAVVFVQCKRGGTLPVGEWNALFDLAVSAGAVPVLAGKEQRVGACYWRLVGRKDGSKRRQPFVRWDPKAAADLPL